MIQIRCIIRRTCSIILYSNVQRSRAATGMYFNWSKNRNDSTHTAAVDTTEEP